MPGAYGRSTSVNPENADIFLQFACSLAKAILQKQKDDIARF